jgi:cob(I)alamin adenosyltransferase
MRIYTKFGDRGETRLFDGTRVSKSHIRVDAYGGVDELCAVLGAASAFVRHEDIQLLISDIQRELLDLGAQLANPAMKTGKAGKGHLTPASVSRLESQIDKFEEDLPRLQNFILSGGGAGGALLHVARTVCRRAERGVVALANEVSVEPISIEYLNRLSDLLFVLARAVNHREGIEEIQW